MTLQLEGNGFPVDGFTASDVAEEATDGPYLPGQLKIVHVAGVTIQLQADSCSFIQRQSASADGFASLMDAAKAFVAMLGKKQLTSVSFTSHGHVVLAESTLASFRSIVVGQLAPIDAGIKSSGAIQLQFDVHEPKARRTIRIPSVTHKGTHQGMVVVELTISRKIAVSCSFDQCWDELHQIGFAGFTDDLTNFEKAVPDGS